jgi:HEAT repeat protein/PBS lyase HEAT-like repeat-containing protein
MSTSNRPKRVAALLFVPALAITALAAEPQLQRDGWTSWSVDAVEGAPAWCCFGNWRERNLTPQTCQLDGGTHGFSIHAGDTTTDTVKVYARVHGGKLDSLQVYAASCPVEAKTPIHDLGSLATDDSARWLIPRVQDDADDTVVRRPIAEGALAALAMHRGELAGKSLVDFARNDARVETRKWSVFWLSQVRGNEGADVTSSVMFNDKDSDVRQHAAFALAQSKSPRVAPDLIRLGNTDKDGGVRAQAWFWLAHTGAPDAEQAIITALRKDSDDNVREQAVFALSQLPEERATRALIAAAEDRSLSREQRKRAVFWLSQSESDAAQAYLDKVLARTTAR